MSIGPKIKAVLENATSLKVYPSLAPDKSKGKYIVFTILGEATLKVLRGRVNLQGSTVQIDCWADSFNEAWDIEKDVRDAMKVPTLNDSPPMFRASQSMEAEHSVDPVTRTHRVMLEFLVWERNA